VVNPWPHPSLFDPIARSHAGDPETSIKAAAEMNKSGRARRHLDAVVGLVRALPGRTSGELAARSDRFDLAEIRRRLTDAARQGLVVKAGARECGEMGTRQTVWVVA
jgi:hypothetical protein